MPDDGKMYADLPFDPGTMVWDEVESFKLLHVVWSESDMRLHAMIEFTMRDREK